MILRFGLSSDWIFYCESSRSGEALMVVWQTSRYSCGVYRVSWNNSNINYQKGAILLLDGDTVQAAVSAHYSTNSLITAPTEIKIPFVRFLLQKFHQSLESQASVLSAFFPLYPLPLKPSPVPRPLLSQAPTFRLQRYIHHFSTFHLLPY